MNIEAKELSKIYGSGESRVVALDKVNLEIASSDFISIILAVLILRLVLKKAPKWVNVLLWGIFSPQLGQCFT
ncbi:hypothetical protein [Intestinimonas butyriciproducens]|uniref:hypothetical protein n=1 Tax=Intestinimonas butyriciproducens TaxID=1297617 RepID=UPI0031194772